MAIVGNSPLEGRHILFLGSSVTYGAASDGISFADFIARRNRCSITKEAVSGTTLVDEDPSSYICRMKKLDKGQKTDLFVCQLSTNDATRRKPLGQVSASRKMEDFDTATVAGAIEYVIAYARESWGCPIVFYTNPRYESAAYDKMVVLLHAIAEKWDISLIDMWNDRGFCDLSPEQQEKYMADPIHPTLSGYQEWWTPYMEPALCRAIRRVPKVIDLTHTIHPDMCVYPGTEKPQLLPANSYEKDGFRETLLHMYSHTGTHMDPPAHLFPEGKTLDQYAPEAFLGKALVIDCRDLNNGAAITMDRLEKYGEKVHQADFLLFNLGWDKLWGTDAYFGDYPCLDDAVLEFIIRGGYKGIGFDVIGLDPIADENLTRHKKLFSRCDTLNIENLKNLELCGEELFSFSCFPLKVENSDGSPIRAIAWFE